MFVGDLCTCTYTFYFLQAFTDVLRRQSMNKSSEGVFFTQYRDVFGGRVLSLSKPVVLKEGNESQEVLGVVGLDVRPDTLMTWLQTEEVRI